MRYDDEKNAGIRKLVKQNLKIKRGKHILLILLVLFVTCFYTCLMFIKYNEFMNLKHNAHLSGNTAAASISLDLASDVKGWIVVLVVSLISVLLINSIQQVSVNCSYTFYGRIKALGAQSKQIRRVVWSEMLLVEAIAVPSGLILGYLAGRELTPLFLNGSLTDVKVYESLWVLLPPFFFTLLIAGLANILPAWHAGKIDIDQAFKYKGYDTDSKKKKRQYPELPQLLQMSIRNLSRYKKRVIVSICLLVVGLVWLSSFYVIKISFDKDKYLAAVTVSDYAVDSGDTSDHMMGSRALYQEALEINDTEGITGTGALYLQRDTQKLPDAVYDHIKRYYEEDKGTRLEQMRYDPIWTRQYKQMQSDRNCRYQIWGIDGLLTDEILQPKHLIKGSFDKEKFLSGKYVIAQGIPGDQDSTATSGTEEAEPTYAPGESVTFAGKKYEVMAVADIPTAVREHVSGAVSGYELSFYMPNTEFHQLYTKVQPQKLFVNTASHAQNQVEKELLQFERNQNLTFQSKQRLTKAYNQGIFAQYGVEVLIGLALVGIGLIQMINSIATSIISRRKEFVLMNKIGMMQRQIRSMLLFESLDVILVTLALAFVLSLYIIDIFIKNYVNSQWTSTFNFSITPLLVLTPCLLIFAVILPLLAYRILRVKEQ